MGERRLRGRPWTTIGLGLGSNIGEPPAMIERALGSLVERGHVRVGRVSSIYRTKPWGPVAQPDFANACAMAATDLAPPSLLAEVKAIETLLGRENGERWGPRAIDIDILFYGETSCDLPELVIPHASLFERAFVLVPLSEIAPDLVIAGRSVSEASRAIGGANVERWDGNVRAAARASRPSP